MTLYLLKSIRYYAAFKSALKLVFIILIGKGFIGKGSYTHLQNVKGIKVCIFVQ